MAQKEPPKSLKNGWKINQIIIQVRFLVFFDRFLTFFIYLDPLIPDDSTANQTLNKALSSAEEALDSFKDCKINDLLCSLPYFEPISINLHPEKPQNLDINKHWHPLELFKLFFNWETMSIII